MGLFSFLSAAKSADAVAESIPKVVDGAMKGIDKIFFTAEEKSEFISGMLKQLYDQFMPRAISRRVISIMMLAVFDIAFLVAVVYACLGETEVVNSIIAIVSAFQMGWIAITIIIFYFGYYGVEKFKKGGK